MLITGLVRFAGEERVTEDIEGACVPLTLCAGERVYGRADYDVEEPGLLKQVFPTCARQATGDSTGPQIDIALGFYRNGSPGGDVGEL